MTWVTYLLHLLWLIAGTIAIVIVAVMAIVIVVGWRLLGDEIRRNLK